MAMITFEGNPIGKRASDEQSLGLERGDILFFPTGPLALKDDDRDFLIGQKQGSRLHKNISYRPAEDRIKGGDWSDPAAKERTHSILRDYSQRAISFVSTLLPSYSRGWRIDFASFRPIEEQGRRISHKARNDLIHVDSFPSRPSHGDRLLRIFTNAHPTRSRVWVTSDHFESLAASFGPKAGMPDRPTDPFPKFRSKALKLLSGAGLPVVDRPEYDRFMLRFHHYLKHSLEFQQGCRKDLWLFPPGSSWMVFTDASSHSCISGQFALEQTFFIRRADLAHPDQAPIAVLEKLAGHSLVA